VFLLLLLLAVGSMFGFFVVSVHVGEKPAFGGTALWNGLPLSGCLRCLLMDGLSPLLEKPDIYNGLYLLGKKGTSIHRAEPVGTRSSTS
jgi:hypothetical protein